MSKMQCPLCRSEDASHFLNGHDLISGEPGEFTLVKCPDCGLVFLDPAPGPDVLARYYGSGYREWQSGARSGLAARMRSIGVRRKVEAVRRHTAAGRLLDVGCGDGDFLAASARGGYEVFGTELDREQAELAARNSGADVRTGGLEESGLEEGSFDVVTMWHFLEHVDGPVAVLSKARELLKPSGLIVVAVPDCASWPARLFGSYWAGYDIPRHLCDFTAGTLERVLSLAGFRVDARSYFIGTFDNVRISIEFAIEGRVNGPRARAAALALARSPLTRLLFTPCAVAAQRLGLGSVVTCFARARGTGGDGTDTGK